MLENLARAVTLANPLALLPGDKLLTEVGWVGSMSRKLPSGPSRKGWNTPKLLGYLVGGWQLNRDMTSTSRQRPTQPRRAHHPGTRP